ncbi:MAG: aminotransferase class III-fold pyridoxal phosphate-dependent enzyme [Bacteroidota bacterium]
MQLFNVYPLFDIEPVKGTGNYVFDKEGNKYLDLYGGHAVISIGHGHPHYVEKISHQVNMLGFYSNSVQNSLQKELAKKLGEMSGCDKYELFLCNSGAEANENALKLASFKTGKTKVISFKKAFHGRTSAAVNVTDKSSIQAPINKLFVKEFHEFNQLKSVKKSLAKGDVCAVIVEGIQGIGGIHVAETKFLEGLSKLCKKHKAVLILDEIQSGFGRSGHFFSYQHADIKPDIISMAKGMGNGFPVGGILINPKVFHASYGLLGTTFGGNHLACAATIAVLDVLKADDLIDNAREVGAYFLEEAKKIKGVKEVRGMGLMIGIDMGYPIKELRKEMLFQRRIFTGSSSDPNVIRLLPPLGLTKREVDVFIKAFSKVLAKHEKGAKIIDFVD